MLCVDGRQLDMQNKVCRLHEHQQRVEEMGFFSSGDRDILGLKVQFVLHRRHLKGARTRSYRSEDAAVSECSGPATQAARISISANS